MWCLQAFFIVFNVENKFPINITNDKQRAFDPSAYRYAIDHSTWLHIIYTCLNSVAVLIRCYDPKRQNMFELKRIPYEWQLNKIVFNKMWRFVSARHPFRSPACTTPKTFHFIWIIEIICGVCMFPCANVIWCEDDIFQIAFFCSSLISLSRLRVRISARDRAHLKRRFEWLFLGSAWILGETKRHYVVKHTENSALWCCHCLCMCIIYITAVCFFFFSLSLVVGLEFCA